MGIPRVSNITNGAQVQGYIDSTGAMRFAVCGQTPLDVKTIKGVLKDASGNDIGKATTVREPPWWAIAFQLPPTTGQFRMEIREGSAPDSAKPLVVVSDLTLQAGPEGITIFYPGSGATVCPDFLAFGGTDDTGAVTGKIIKGGNEVTGQTLANGPDWIVSFTNIPDDTGYSVRASTGASTHTNSNITVSEDDCLEAEGPTFP